MKLKYTLIIALCLSLSWTSCKREPQAQPNTEGIAVNESENLVKYAKTFQLFKKENYFVLKLLKPYPGATEALTYILATEGAKLDPSLSATNVIKTPLKSLVVTSTTHIPPLEDLGVLHSLVGFPNTDLISSKEARKLIDAKAISEVGAGEELNTERILELQPQMIVLYGMDGENKMAKQLERAKQQLLYNSDWLEESALGKAEWIKFFGVLYNKYDLADKMFQDIEKEYNELVVLAKSAQEKPKVLSGGIYNDVWYLPKGETWAAQFLNDANSNYPWAGEKGSGSLALNLEQVLETAQDADVWIGPGNFITLSELKSFTHHYAQFKAVKEQQVYSFGWNKGAKGGIIYYELAPNRPNLVLKDLIKILHPALLPDYETVFYKKLN